jgi:hypothetical protein
MKQLRARHGDFFKCNDQGTQQAIQTMRATILVADTEETRQGIKEAMALVRQSRIPVVNFTSASLQASSIPAWAWKSMTGLVYRSTM